MNLVKKLVLGLVFFFLAGCTGHSYKENGDDQLFSYSEIDVRHQVECFAATPVPITYPLESAMSFSAFIPEATANPLLSKILDEIKMTTNVELQCEIIPNDDYLETLSVAFDSSSLPDLVWGIDESLILNKNNDNILVLNELLATNAPNYLDAIKRDPYLACDVTLENGDVVQFYSLMEEEFNLATMGPVINGKILDQLGLSIPRTFEEWENFLLATKGNLTDPFFLLTDAFFNANYLSSGYGLSIAFESADRGFYQIEGNVKFGMLEKDFYPFISLLHKWYDNELISKRFLDMPDYFTSDYLLKCAEGNYGIFFSHYSQLETINLEAESTFYPISTPKIKNKGNVHLAQNKNELIYEPGFSISTSCTAPQFAVRFIDYLYSNEGVNICNTFSNDSYVSANWLEDEFQINNSNDKFHINIAGIIQKKTSIALMPRTMLNASQIWGTDTDSQYALPARLCYSEDEKEELSALLSDIITYSSSSVLELIIGERPITEIPKIQEELKRLGIDRCMEIIQTSMNRYLLRRPKYIK